VLLSNNFTSSSINSITRYYIYVSVEREKIKNWPLEEVKNFLFYFPQYRALLQRRTANGLIEIQSVLAFSALCRKPTKAQRNGYRVNGKIVIAISCDCRSFNLGYTRTLLENTIGKEKEREPCSITKVALNKLECEVGMFARIFNEFFSCVT
jgi:hypothetical protein